MSNASLSIAAADAIPLDELALCVRRLDPGTRALLDLSVRRGVRDDAMAPVLRTDPFHLAWRRARALERLAVALEADTAPPLSDVRAALSELPDEVWSPVPLLNPPAADRLSLALVVRPSTELAPPRRRARFRLRSLRAVMRRALRRRRGDQTARA